MIKSGIVVVFDKAVSDGLYQGLKLGQQQIAGVRKILERLANGERSVSEHLPKGEGNNPVLAALCLFIASPGLMEQSGLVKIYSLCGGSKKVGEVYHQLFKQFLLPVSDSADKVAYINTEEMKANIEQSKKRQVLSAENAIILIDGATFSKEVDQKTLNDFLAGFKVGVGTDQALKAKGAYIVYANTRKALW